MVQMLMFMCTGTLDAVVCEQMLLVLTFWVLMLERMWL